MAKEKRLNIGNSNRHFNVNLMSRDDILNKNKVNRLNEDDIEKDMDELEEKTRRIPLRDDKDYIIYQEKYSNDKLIKKLISHGGGVSYYTDSIVPYYVIKQLANHTNSEVIYPIQKKFTDDQIRNIELAFMATEVIIDCPIVIPDISPYDFLFALHDIKIKVDKVQLSYPPLREVADRHLEFYTKKEDGLYHMKPEYMYGIFKRIQDSLSIWKMNIWLMSNTAEDHEELEKYIEKDLDKRSPSRKKKKKEKVGTSDE